jgi:hypothetical protein
LTLAVALVTFRCWRHAWSAGAVLGVDRAASSVQTARDRPAAVGIANVRFEEAELECGRRSCCGLG